MKAIDYDKNERIPIRQLYVLMTKLGEEQLSEDEFKELLKDLNAENADFVNLNEMFTLFSSTME